jgi:hypothetical protein
MLAVRHRAEGFGFSAFSSEASTVTASFVGSLVSRELLPLSNIA